MSGNSKSPPVEDRSSGKRGGEAITTPPAEWTCLQVFRAAPTDRIGLIKNGVSARWAKSILQRLTPTEIVEVLGISPATINRRAAADAKLSVGVSERVVGMAALVGQVEAMVAESGDVADFDAVAWLADWLTAPLPALGGVRPIEHMDTSEGRVVVSSMLSRMQSSAYA